MTTAKQSSAALMRHKNSEFEGRGGSDKQPPIDLKLFSKILGDGNEQVLFTMLNKFIEIFPDLRIALETAVSERDARSSYDAAHNAKSAANSAAAVPLAKLLATIEAESESEDWSRLEKWLGEVKAECRRIDDFVRTHGRSE